MKAFTHLFDSKKHQRTKGCKTPVFLPFHQRRTKHDQNKWGSQFTWTQQYASHDITILQLAKWQRRIRLQLNARCRNRRTSLNGGRLGKRPCCPKKTRGQGYIMTDKLSSLGLCSNSSSNLSKIFDLRLASDFGSRGSSGWLQF